MGRSHGYKYRDGQSLNYSSSHSVSSIAKLDLLGYTFVQSLKCYGAMVGVSIGKAVYKYLSTVIDR